MPSIDYYVNVLVAEANEDNPAIRSKLELRAREVAMELLRAGDGRFEKLKKTQTININTTDTRYLLNTDFNKVRKTFNEVDSSGNFMANIYCLSERASQRRLSDDSPIANITYVEYDPDGADGPGYYLVLAAQSSSARTFKFEYYRKYSSDDIEIIDDETTVKRGIRMGMLKQFPDTAQNDAYIYARRLNTFGEDPEDVMTDIILVPDRHKANLYRVMWRAGRGH